MSGIEQIVLGTKRPRSMVRLEDNDKVSRRVVDDPLKRLLYPLVQVLHVAGVLGHIDLPRHPLPTARLAEVWIQLSANGVERPSVLCVEMRSMWPYDMGENEIRPCVARFRV